jgi:hypothetical protein
MPRPTKTAIVASLLAGYGQTFSAEAGFDANRNQPAPLFRLLCLSLLLSAPIRSEVAVEAARALARRGWTTAPRMAAAPWDERARTLKAAGYARYDERTSTQLERTASKVQTRWKGDLRRLREEAEHDPAVERRLLAECKGIGDVGVDIFFREIQLAWDELFPFADERTLRAADRLGLAATPRRLAALVARHDMTRLVAALVRVDLRDAYGDVMERVRLPRSDRQGR